MGIHRIRTITIINPQKIHFAAINWHDLVSKFIIIYEL
jgi:hypothetical protein